MIRREATNELERIEEDGLNSGKSQYNAAARWNLYHYLMGIPAVLAGAGAGSAIIGDYPTVGGILAFVAAVLSALQTFVKASERAAQHKAAGDQYLALKNDARFTRLLKLADVEPPADVELVEALVARRNALNEGSPQIAKRDHKKTLKGIAAGEAIYEVDRRF